jgi:hypothetical protein
VHRIGMRARGRMRNEKNEAFGIVYYPHIVVEEVSGRN